MKIQFEIKETLAGILDQLLHSDFWITEVEEIDDKRKRIKIRDFAYPQEATAEVSENEILLKTAWSKYTYLLVRIYRGLSGIIGTKASPYHNAERESARSACSQLITGRHAQAFARICHGQSEAEEVPSTDLRRHWLLDQRSSETGVRCVYQGRLYS